MEEYLSDHDPLAILAEEIRSLKEEMKKSNVVTQVQQEQKLRDQADMRKALLETIDKVRIPVQRVQLPDGAAQALDDFNKNYCSINRRPLVGNLTAKLFLYGAVALTLASAFFGFYCYIQLWHSKDAYARRAYYAATTLEKNNPEAYYAWVTSNWEKNKKAVKLRVKYMESKEKDKE